MKRLLLFLIVIPFISQSYSQDTTNMGTDFWVGYGHHQFMEDWTNSQEMVLYFTTDSLPAVVTLSIDSTSWTYSMWWRRVYNIPAYTTVSIANYPATTYSSQAGISGPMPKGASGQNDARLYTIPPPAGSASTGLFRRKGIRVESDVPIAVHAQISGNATSGATMVLPVKSWGYNYTAVNSRQNYNHQSFSWLFIIAKENNTVIEITPSVRVRSQYYAGLSPGQPTTITLHKGQIYQVLGANDSADVYGHGGNATSGKDLTGTKVKALVQGKPVAVFAGSSRTNVSATCGTGSGDNDIVQLFPLHTWGRSYLTAPTSNSNAVSVFHSNWYKIVVQDSTTIVRRNGILLTGIVDGKYYTYQSNTPGYIEADKPIMVAQFMNGNDCISTTLGDADMYYLSPMDAGVNRVTTMRTTRENVTIQYLTLIVPTAGLPSLRIDGSQVFDHSYAHGQYPGRTVVVKRWTRGNAAVTITCDSTFTGITYGLGQKESYGFNIGRNLGALNSADPLVIFRWLGVQSTDWNNPLNWSTGTIPTANDNVQVPAGTLYNLTITTGMEVSCQTLTIDPGAIVTVETGGVMNVLR